MIDLHCFNIFLHSCLLEKLEIIKIILIIMEDFEMKYLDQC